jgi:cytidine deaminase
MSSPASPNQEIVVALAGAVGTELEHVADELAVVLGQFGFDAGEISLSAGLRQVSEGDELVDEPYDERLWSYMDGGNALRERWQRGDALALLAIREVAARRARLSSPRAAYILRSVKHPAEVATLRSVYGSRFFLVSAYRPRELRLSTVRGLIERSRKSADDRDWSFLPEHLLERDEHEMGDYGQQVRETFPLADFFIAAADRERIRPQLERFAALVFGDPFRTPAREEYALACADVAAHRSAELGRQVGACLTAADGDVIALGANEVPKAGGGLYWDGDDGDAREFHLGADTNDERKREIAEDIVDELSNRQMLNRNPDEVPEPTDVLEAILRSRLGALTEFGRAVHAEMAALLDAARRGVPVVGSTLYATTFPCHNCARHLIAAGVREVIYVAPYAKSQAYRLHADSVVVAAADPPEDKLHLRPFVGVAPRLYRRVFAAGDRKTGSGKVIAFDGASARLVLAKPGSADLQPDHPAYLAREARANEVLERQLSESAADEDTSGVYEE